MNKVLAVTHTGPQQKILTIQCDKTSINNQLCLFNSDARALWLAQSLEIAKSIPSPFFFSELRERLLFAPHHPNAWGSLAKALMKAGFERTGEYRKSTVDSRKGGLDWRYRRPE